MKLIKLCLFAFISSISLSAENNLSLKECIDIGINTHPDINVAKQDIKYNKLNDKNIIGGYLPQLSLDLEYNPTKTVVLPVNGELQTIETDGYSANLNLSQTIWDYGKTTDNLNINKNIINISKYNLNDTKSGLSFKIKSQYELMYFLKEVIKVKEADLKVKEELYKKSQQQVKQGQKTKIDEKRFLTSVYNARDAFENAKLDYIKSEQTMSNYLNKEIKNVTLIETKVIDNLLKYENNNYNVNNAPGIKSLTEDIKIKYNNIKLNKKEHYGSINLKGNLSYQNSINDYDTSYVGIEVKIPLYTGGRTSNKIEQSRISKNKSEFILSSKKRNALEDYNNSLIDVKKFKQTIKTKKLQIENAKDTLEIVNERWKVGMATYIEVLDSNSVLLNSKLNLLETKFNLKQTLHKLEYLNGEIE